MSIQDRLKSREAAAVTRDGAAQHEAKSMEGSNFKTAPVGKCRARLCGYIELGEHIKKTKEDSKRQDQFKLRFALYGKGDDYTNEDGSPVTVDTFPMLKSHSAKSQAVKMFSEMCPLRDADHFIGLMVDRVFWLEITHTKSKDSEGKEKTYANIKRGSVVPGLRDLMDDDYNVIGQAPVEAPELEAQEINLYEWDVPTKEDWESLRSYDQDKIRTALNFPGSALEALVGGGNPAAADEPEEEEQGADDNAPVDNGTPANVSVDADDLPPL